MRKAILPAVLAACAMLAAGSAAEAASTTAKRLTPSLASPSATALSQMARSARSSMKSATFDDKALAAVTAGNPRPQGVAGAVGAVAGAATPRAYGIGAIRWPYTEARVANSSSQPGTALEDSPVSAQPYRATGRLYMRFGADWYVCTAALVKKGILITAAHCVQHFGKGMAGFTDEVLWVPANTADLTGPFGVYTAAEVRIPTPYFNGTDSCSQTGVVCNNDLATVTLNPRDGQQAGEALGGWYNYGWNGYSFAANKALGGATVADITQLGYPGAFDDGNQMQRNNSFAKFVVQKRGARLRVLTTTLGSPLSGGSSGGPWLVNFGTAPQIDSEASPGLAANRNVVVAVTGYGSSTVGINLMGASWFGQNKEYPGSAYGSFGAGNIGKLMLDTCASQPGNC